MVRTELAAPEPGIKESGEKEQRHWLGQPVTERKIGLSKDPDCMLAVTWRFFDWPAERTIVEGEAPKDRSGGAATVWQAAL
jgi:hypothetical protein